MKMPMGARMAGLRNSDGFTLLELIIVVAVAAFIMAIITPSIRQAGESFRLRQAANATMSELRRAQAGAMSEGVDYTVEFVLGTPGSLNVYRQTTLQRTVAGTANWPSTVSIVSAGSTFPVCTSPGNAANKCVTFISLGSPSSAGTAQLRSGTGVTVSVVVAAATGRVSVQRP